MRKKCKILVKKNAKELQLSLIYKKSKEKIKKEKSQNKVMKKLFFEKFIIYNGKIKKRKHSAKNQKKKLTKKDVSQKVEILKLKLKILTERRKNVLNNSNLSKKDFFLLNELEERKRNVLNNPYKTKKDFFLLNELEERIKNLCIKSNPYKTKKDLMYAFGDLKNMDELILKMEKDKRKLILKNIFKIKKGFFSNSHVLYSDRGKLTKIRKYLNFYGKNSNILAAIKKKISEVKKSRKNFGKKRRKNARKKRRNSNFRLISRFEIKKKYLCNYNLFFSSLIRYEKERKNVLNIYTLDVLIKQELRKKLNFLLNFMIIFTKILTFLKLI